MTRPGNFLFLCLLAATVIAIGRANAAEIETGVPEDSTRAAELTIHRDASRLAIAGAVSSTAHEAILREVAGQSNPATSLRFDVRESPLTPPGWALVTELALRAALLTNSSETSVTAERVFIRGVTSDAKSWIASLARLESALLPGMTLKSAVVNVDPEANFHALCRQAFDALTKDSPFEFAIASSAIGSNAQSLLDGIVETATDCPDAVIGIRANGDGPVAVAANRTLAEARAASIADYLAAHGLDPARIRLLPAEESAHRRARQVGFTVTFERSDTPADAGYPGAPSH